MEIIEIVTSRIDLEKNLLEVSFRTIDAVASCTFMARVSGPSVTLSIATGMLIEALPPAPMVTFPVNEPAVKSEALTPDSV